MHTSQQSNELVTRGKLLFDGKGRYVRFTGQTVADRLLNSTRKYPHAFVIGCLMDRQIKAERAWIIPHEIRNRLGSFEFQELVELSNTAWNRLMSSPTSLHHYANKMANEAYFAIQKINDDYGGDASAIWRNKPSSAKIISRFLEFKGIGVKVATMATNILARGLKVPMSDYYSIDISVDTHVKRVFRRLGFVEEGATNEQVIYAARSIHPKFPGILDFPTWEIGREWCKPKNPRCNMCYMNTLCPTSQCKTN